MNDLKIKKYLYNQVPLKILSFLSNQPGRVFSANEVSNAAKCSKGATNQTLRLLLKLDILSREIKGNLFLYKLNADNIVLRQFKIFENLLDVQKLVREIQEYCCEIVLFGSRADGSNTGKSDIDLFIQTEYKKEVRGIINKYETMDVKYQSIIQDPLESVSSKKEDSVFHRQVKKGITLWKGKPTYEEI
ncbi:MAG: nucleotidyltransferase domain-containing protein [Candidatus Omnitrophica bacterium]|nr:nucleotidyltransferase domain-containing protein [Candidatus Omnitrophota bacterium]